MMILFDAWFIFIQKCKMKVQNTSFPCSLVLFPIPLFLVEQDTVSEVCLPLIFWWFFFSLFGKKDQLCKALAGVQRRMVKLLVMHCAHYIEYLLQFVARMCIVLQTNVDSVWSLEKETTGVQEVITRCVLWGFV